MNLRLPNLFTALCLIFTLFAGHLEAQLVVREDFQDGDAFPFLIEKSNGATARIQELPSGNKIFAARHLRNESDAKLVLYLESPEEVTSIFVEHRARFPDGIPTQGFSTVKMLRIANSEGGEISTVLMFYSPETDEIHVGYQSARSGNGPHGNIPVDLDNRWHRIGLFVRYNTLGRSNGILRIFWDGQMIAEHRNVDFFEGIPGKPDLVINGMNANFLDPTLADQWVPFRRWIDNIRVIIR